MTVAAYADESQQRAAIGYLPTTKLKRLASYTAMSSSVPVPAYDVLSGGRIATDVSSYGVVASTR